MNQMHGGTVEFVSYMPGVNSLTTHELSCRYFFFN